LFIAPIGARSQEPTQPVFLDKPCSVSVDSRWTRQEKFVWEHAGVGAVADLNAAPEYGGDRDPTNPAEWPQSRVLRPAFLRTILFEDLYRRTLTRRGVSIRGARFTEAVDLENAELEHPLELEYSLLEKGINLRRVRSKFPIGLRHSNVAGIFDMYELQLDADMDLQNGKFTDVGLVRAHVRLLDLTGSRVTGNLDMTRLQVDQTLSMTDNAEFADAVLSGAHVGGDLDLRGAKVTGKLDMTRLQVDQTLSMTDNAEFADAVLSGAHVGGDLDLRGAKVTGKLDMRGLHVDQSVGMNDKAEFADVSLAVVRVGNSLSLSGSKVTRTLDMDGLRVGAYLVMDDRAKFADVVLSGAHVGGDLGLSSAKVAGKLDMTRLQVDQTLSMTNKAEFANVVLTGARVGGYLDLRGAKVTGKLDMSGFRVDQSLGMSDEAEFADVVLAVARVGNSLGLSGAKVTGHLDCYGLEVGQQVLMDHATFGDSINCRIAKIKGDLHLSDSRFKKDVDLSGAEIGGFLYLDSAQWSDGITLVLRDAKVGIIPTLADTWTPKLDLDGFSYRGAGAADKFKGWLGRLDRYAPQPYDQLASVVESQGNRALATEIRYSGRERERSEAMGTAWAGLSTLKWVIGYGYYPYFAMFWVIGLVMVGALILRVSDEGRRNGMPYGLTYSFDLLLPIIRLRESHYQIDLKTWARYYFYGHKIMGYLLASFLIAGLAGLTK